MSQGKHIYLNKMRDSKETISAYKYDVSLFVSHFKDNLLSKMMVVSYFQSLIKDGYKASSIKRKRISISLFLDYLKVNKKIKVNYTKETVLNIKDEKSVPKTIPVSIIKKCSITYIVKEANAHLSMITSNLIAI